MKSSLTFLLLAAAGLALTASVGRAQEFIVCSSTYALCTTALCTPIADTPGFDSCSCNVMTGYSAGQSLCQNVQDTGEGQAILSRYYPITSYAYCSNDRPWANCLDSPCLIDQNNPSSATCICTETVNQGPYLVINADGQYNPATCTTGLHSSATVAGADALTRFLKTHRTPLRPFPIRVYYPPD
ncbi:MAG TPA: hypothetical protein VHY56_13070 [Candidatus Binataceae bacterium]|nr:hypothetical protein [Candidatus Binataceae bacterium]